MRSRFTLFSMVLVFMPILAIVFLLGTEQFNHRKIPVLGELADFSLLERNGSVFQKSDLSGTIWVADFIFTRCSGQCPILSAQMKRLQKRLRLNSRARLVSISVDPKHDTPDALQSYANKWEADPKKWLFLTGAESEIRNLLSKSFRVTSSPIGKEDVLHSDKLVLVDSVGKIRGYYSGSEEKGIKMLLSDIKQLTRKLKQGVYS